MEVDERDAEAWRRHIGERADGDLVGALTTSGMPELLRSLAARSGGRLEVGDSAVPHRELAAVVAGVAGRLDVRRGERVLLLAPSSLELVLLYLAASSRGCSVVLANPSSTPAELATLVRAARPVLAVSPPDLAVGLAGADVDVVDPAVVADGPPGDPGELDATADDVAILAFTSGTTGVPKAVPLRHRHLLASIRGAAWAWGIGPEDHIVHALPLFHQHGLSAVHAALATGCSVTVRTAFGPDLVERAAQVRATVLFAVPTMYGRLVEEPGFTAAGLPDLRLAVSGSSALAPDLFARIEERLGMPPLERYGTTESGLDVSNPLVGTRLPGAVGLPLPGVELRIRDQQGRDVVDGEPGEICVRGPQVFEGYLGDEAATAAATWRGGWFRTGDVGVRSSAGGSVAIVGRLKEMIVTGGMNVYPAEVEAAVTSLPGVAEAAVAGRPSERWGEEVVAYVVARGEIDPAAVIAGCREQLAAYKCPKAVVVVDALPRNAMGKVVRGRLADVDPS